MKKVLVVFAVFTAMILTVSCDDALKFKPYEGNNEVYQGDSDDIETSDADMSDNESGNTDSGSDSGDSIPTPDNDDYNNGGDQDNNDMPKDHSLPKPIIHVTFDYPIQKPMSYRSIYDSVQMNLKDTCVALKDDPNKCDPEWKNKYYIRYKWEMTESPTPLSEESRLKLTDMDASAGQWLADDGGDNPKRARFTGLMITPRRYPGEANPTYNADKCASECGSEPVYDKDNPDDFLFLKISDYLICRQKYCEKNLSKYYKVNIQAETVNKETGFVSDTADITIVPKIVPQARVAAQLTWKQGFKTRAESESKEGVQTDLDLHFIKKISLEAESLGFSNKEGLLGTIQRTSNNSCGHMDPDCEKYWRHDDCSFSDQGHIADYIDGTIQWYASLVIDNTWGGGNYENPEIIGLGPLVDKDGDGKLDDNIIDDQYLVVVGYVYCQSRYYDGTDRCDEQYSGEDGAFEVDARVEILVDGDEAPRKAGSDRPADSYTSDFKIKLNEWKAIAVIKWDNSWKSSDSNPAWKGNAIVTDKAMTEEGITTDPVSHPICSYDNADAVLIPIWDAETYRNYIENGIKIGTCN